MTIEKSPQAFRTISEASEILSLPCHVLRFWESKFSQIKPIKRAGGRRFYRPNDILFIFGIKKLLHNDGLTISGVKRLIKQNGNNYIINIGENIKKTKPCLQPKEKKFNKFDLQNSKIDKQQINEIVNKLNFLRSKIEGRIIKDLCDV